MKKTYLSHKTTTTLRLTINTDQKAHTEEDPEADIDHDDDYISKSYYEQVEEEEIEDVEKDPDRQRLLDSDAYQNYSMSSQVKITEQLTDRYELDQFPELKFDKTLSAKDCVDV
ncbi:hypothetical protein CHS0354_036709 [Potamilus streckersoni]|uniref:Uncharacterized protein n=1 Tax=Potamilus streckersoni TaxID=2493646 RepID=A0AAE0TCK9_9BIVA|nr:hypothetical protein CHS0354_036709 [Potamilus streckersoni]